MMSDQIRDAFAFDKGLAYLDTAASAQKPVAVLEAMRSFGTQSYANIHRGVYALSAQATQAYEDARGKVAGLINAHAQEVVIVSGTTHACNLLAHSAAGLRPGRTSIVVSALEHHANLVPWQQLAKRTGMELRVINIKEDYTLDLDDAYGKIDDTTALVAITHLSNALGTVVPVDKVIAAARSSDALVFVDAAQSVAHMPIDVKALDCDFLAFSAHKLYGPTGIGALYGKYAHLEAMEPFLTGGDMIHTVSYTDATWAQPPMKFEAGTQAIIEAIGFGAAVDFVKQIGFETIVQHDKELYAYASQRLGDMEGVQLFAPPMDSGSSIISFSLDNTHPHDVASLLASKGVCVRGGHHCAMPLMERLGVVGTLRASFGVYTTKQDIDRLLDGLGYVREVLRGDRHG